MTQSSWPSVEINTIRQPVAGRVVDVLRDALKDGRFTEMRAAVAYITTSGVGQIDDALSGSNLSCSWLTAFDWCRSEPAALGALDRAKRSNVRIHAGGGVVGRRGCVPATPFHPKCFLFTGPSHALLVSGSGNLSANGLSRGVEFDTVVKVARRGGGSNSAAWTSMMSVGNWFDSLWQTADRYRGLADRYQAEFGRRPPEFAPLDFGDAPDLGRGRFTASQLAQVSQASTMWIEAGNLTARGSTSPGHQLMMRPYTRVFFGVVSTLVPKKTRLGSVWLVLGNEAPVALSMEFAHNSMDRLNLPSSDAAGPVTYDGEVLVFRKRADPGRVVFELAKVSARERTKLRNESKRTGLLFQMSGPGREFGFL